MSQLPSKWVAFSLKCQAGSAPLPTHRLYLSPVEPITYRAFPYAPSTPLSSWRSLTQLLKFSSGATSSRKLALNASRQSALNASALMSQGSYLPMCVPQGYEFPRSCSTEHSGQRERAGSGCL